MDDNKDMILPSLIPLSKDAGHLMPPNAVVLEFQSPSFRRRVFYAALTGRIVRRLASVLLHHFSDRPSQPAASHDISLVNQDAPQRGRSEERRVGKECRSRWSP